MRDIKHMRYLLRIDALDRFPEIDITEEQYLEYENARKILNNALRIEETYEILLSSFADLEKEMLNATLSHMMSFSPDYDDFFQLQLSLNIRLVNVLTAARLYLDQLPQYICNCLPLDSTVKDSIKKLRSDEYDAWFEYRFMEALRNYVQHKGIPVHWTSLPSKWTSEDENREMEFSVHMGSAQSVLQDSDFKKSVLAEMPEKVDLKAATRSYIECLSRIHCAARKMIADCSNTARALMEKAHKQYAEVYKEQYVGLSACAWSGEGSCVSQVSSVPLLLNWDDIRLRLIKKNKEMVNLRKRYVTGQNQK